MLTQTKREDTGHRMEEVVYPKGRGIPADIVPVFFEGRNSNFFYRLANMRKALGIKMNYEMIYLPDEMFKSKHKTYSIHFGKPIPWQTFDNSKTRMEWAQYVKEQVYSIRDSLNKLKRI